MTAIAYPPALPGPISAPLQSVERRLLSSLPGPRQSRALQRDRLAGQQVDFIFTNAQAAIFAAWVKNDLYEGGAWFSANWQQPQGGPGARRFIGAPSYPQYLPAFGWHVSAVCEVRGQGVTEGISNGDFVCYTFHNDFAGDACDIVSLALKGEVITSSSPAFRWKNPVVVRANVGESWFVYWDFHGTDADGKEYVNFHVNSIGQIDLIATGRCKDPSCTKNLPP